MLRRLLSLLIVAGITATADGAVQNAKDFDAAALNKTVQMVLTQGFFNNLTLDFINPLLADLSILKLPDITNGTLSIEHSSVNFNISNAHVASAGLNGSVPIIQIGEDVLQVQISDLELEIKLDYEFITDPPLLADIGEFTISIRGLSFSTLLNTSLSENKTLSVDLHWISLNFTGAGALINIDGLNDFGTVVNNTGNTLISIIRNRLVSIVNEQLITP